MIKLSPLLLLSFFVAACATTHNGRPIALSNTPTVALSTGAVYELSDKYYTFVEYTVENKSAEWLDVKVEGVLVNGVETELLTGDKLKSWIEGADLKLRKNQYNSNLLLASFAVAGMATAAGSGSNNWRKAGLATTGIALGASAANDISQAKKQASTNRSTKDIRTSKVEVPESNVLIPFKVAPESYVKRWLVIKYPRDNWGKLVTGIAINGHKTDAFVSEF